MENIVKNLYKETVVYDEKVFFVDKTLAMSVIRGIDECSLLAVFILCHRGVDVKCLIDIVKYLYISFL